jgi:hypothetical protein
LRAARLFLFITLAVGRVAAAAAPLLYHRAAFESPASGAPDDLLLLAGYGFAAGDTVVYRAVRNTAEHLPSPADVPTDSTAESGVAPIVGAADLPYSLTVKLPQVLRDAQSYSLWVRNARGEWSEPVTINDARPLWSSPSQVFTSGMPASLPREIKIVGRNLQPAPGHSTQVRLIGPQEVRGRSITDVESPALGQYVARVRLPGHLAPGTYRVQVSRDDASWIELAGQSLQVLPDPPALAEFSVSDARFGGCRPDVGVDTTPCIVRAVEAAQKAGGGVVDFGPGTWDLIDARQPGLVAGEGIVVPAGVGLRGAGSSLTHLQRHAQWNSPAPAAAFTFAGHTVVTGFTFRDLQIYHADDRAGPFLQLGENWQRVASAPGAAAGAARGPGGNAIVSDVTITGNVFDKPMVGIGSGGLPIERLFITYNVFGAYGAALELGGDQFNMVYEYRLDDAVIDHNVFKPGSKLDLIHKTGTIASELGAGRRVDFSGNTADGASTDYLYSADDPRGWRAGFFWNMDNDVEEVLIAQNTATCTGDKIGDGEAIALDNNHNTFAFKSAPTAVRATAATVVVAEALATRQNDRAVPIASYYVGHWVQIVSGPGLGQARRIVDYSTAPATQQTTFRVAPDWDVVPAPGRTRIAVGREFWQLYVLDNHIDNRRPLCRKSNRSRRAAGQIVLWAQSADSVIAGNQQYDSDGIFLQQNYIVPEHPCAGCTMQGFFQSFVEVRANTVDGKYDWASDCSTSGIVAGVAAAPWGDSAPPTVGFGISISHNRIRHADAKDGGAVGQLNSWYAGPVPHRWPLSDGMLIHHNSISDIDGPSALPHCGPGHARIGITFPDSASAWHTVLYANSCKNVTVPVGRGGVGKTTICPSSVQDSCECQAPAK